MCLYNKFGFCKFQGECKRIHLTEVCGNISNCKDVKECQKKQPKKCKRFIANNGCRFREDCAYNHQSAKDDEERNELKEKVDILDNIVTASTIKLEKLEQLETVVKAMCRRVINLRMI